MAAYKIFSQMLRTFKTFSGEDKSHAQPRRVVDKIHKFYEICEEIRKVQQRQVICALL